MPDQISTAKIVGTALSVAISIIILLVSAWAVDMSRRIQGVEDRQRDVLIRLRSLEYQFDRKWDPTGQ